MGVFSGNFSWLNPFSWFDTDKNFYPLNNSLSYQIGTEGPVLIDTTKPALIYHSVPEFRFIVDRFARMFSNGYIRIVDKEGKDVSDKYADFLKMMENPNPLQSQNEFLFELAIQLNSFGNQYIYTNKPSPLIKSPLSLRNIPACYVNPVLTGKLLDQTEIEGIIKYFEYNPNGSVQAIETDKIVYNKIPDLENPIIGRSPVVALQYPTSNIIQNYRYRNKALSSTGAIGYFTRKSGKDGVTRKKSEKDQILKTYTEGYGIAPGQKAVNYFDAEVDFKHTVFPFKDMLLLEDLAANKQTICNMYGLDINLFGSDKSTFENVKNGLIRSYQDAIIPFADSISQSMSRNKNMGIDFKAGHRIVFKYDHIPVLMDAKKEGANGFKTMVESLEKLVAMNILTAAEVKKIIQTELSRITG